MIDNKLIFVWSRYNRVHIWDTNKGEIIQTLDASQCLGLRISGDGSRIFFLGEDFIQVWSIWTWEPVDKVKLGLEGILYLDSLHIDSSRVWICSMDSSAQEGWDFETSPVPFDPSTERPHLDFVGCAGWQIEGSSWIKDIVTGKKAFQLSGRYAKPNDVQWDGHYLVAGYDNGEVLILDFDHLYPH